MAQQDERAALINKPRKTSLFSTKRLTLPLENVTAVQERSSVLFSLGYFEVKSVFEGGLT